MKSKILPSSLVVDFIDVGFNTKDITAHIEAEIAAVLKTVTNGGADDWRINFCVWYNYVNQILIYTKNRSYPVEKCKEITIHIPIPTINVVKWGVNKSQHIYDSPDHLNDKINNFDRLDVDFSLFENRTDYLTDCMRRSVLFCFEKGFTVNGVKIKTGKRTEANGAF